jgi:lysophospholipase L1-like esterase
MRTRPVAVALILGLLPTLCALRAQSVLKPGDVLLICGDSITEQKQYSAFIEDYILMSQPVRDVKTIQVGWGGETARHFADFWEPVVLAFAPTVATVNFGMNDGGYDLFREEMGKGYRDSLAKAIAKFKESGVRTVLISSPGVVDSYYFKNPKHSDVTAGDYNRTLGRLGDSGRQLALSEGEIFADVHAQMMDTMARVKAVLGEQYPVAGNQDGVHPLPNGHLVMAYAFLKAMGFDGNIGRITWDAGTGQSEATEGHRVVASNNGEVTIESTRYPFCFREGEAVVPVQREMEK